MSSQHGKYELFCFLKKFSLCFMQALTLSHKITTPSSLLQALQKNAFLVLLCTIHLWTFLYIYIAHYKSLTSTPSLYFSVIKDMFGMPL